MKQTQSTPSVLRHSQEQIQQIVALYDKRHGLTVKEFCKRHGISEPSFYSTRRRNHSTSNSAETTGFIALTPSLPEAPSSTLFAQVGSIKLYQAVPAEYLKTLAS